MDVHANQTHVERAEMQREINEAAAKERKLEGLECGQTRVLIDRVGGKPKSLGGVLSLRRVSLPLEVIILPTVR